MGSKVQKALLISAIILGGAVTVQAVPAALTCFQTPACLTEVTVALAEGAAGDALGGSTLMAVGVSVTVKSADKLRAIDGLLDDLVQVGGNEGAKLSKSIYIDILETPPWIAPRSFDLYVEGRHRCTFGEV